MNAFDNFFFIALPYAALLMFFVGTIYRYKATKFKFSSLSSQFLETRKLYWGSVPFHWGILFLFFGHLIAFLFPSSILLWNQQPVRLAILEISAFVGGIIAFVGIISLLYRRLTNPRIRKVTNYMDNILELLLIIQIFLGLWVAYGYRWGSSWFASILTPYLNSIFSFNPNIDAVIALPLVVQLHIILAFIIFMIIPFTRLVHLLVFPLSYLWRPYQKVIWNWNRRQVRNSRAKWNIHKPNNT
ncbi:MAG: respiratory nitrate reductase subunit gamma [Ignavibacteriae bacterium]|jgi:nitrate reductase gamma subunit|nr:respiratory nitrate reductase subunit gamma [Ignavibacteriota bacterium]NOG98486.1 respiratory nitrate reductase subunit gamma [Ignavibacteriota bacterium]